MEDQDKTCLPKTLFEPEEMVDDGDYFHYEEAGYDSGEDDDEDDDEFASWSSDASSVTSGYTSSETDGDLSIIWEETSPDLDELMDV
jgi:hypothetical protein